MSRLTLYQSNFTQGEVDPLMHGRVDIEQYYSALDRAKNVMIMPQGGFERRPGSRFMFDLTSHLGSYTALAGIRLIPFEFSIDQSFMLLFVKQSTSDVRMFVFANQVQITNINGSGNDYLSINMGDIDLSKVNFTQSADTLILVQEDIVPRKIVRGSTNATWTESSITLTSPKYNFTTGTTNPAATITPDAVDGTVKLTASAATFPAERSATAQGGASSTITLDGSASGTDDLYNGCKITITSGTGSGQTRFISDYVGSSKIATVSVAWTVTPASDSVFTTSDHVGQYINVNNGFGRAKIIERNSEVVDGSTQLVVKAMVEIPFFEASVAIASGDYEIEYGYEDVFSSDRGYPRSCTFHEGRLFFGGSKSLPNTIFGSKVSDFYNFQSGEMLADDALLVTLSTDSINSINAIRSGRDLQIFTSSGEFFIPQSTLDPITPSNLVIKSSTRRGIKEGIRPTGTEAATFFIQRSGKSLREFLFSDSDLNYNSNNVSLFSSHLLKAPTKMALRSATSTDDGDLLMIVNSTDGTMAVYTMLRPQNVVAPVEWVTNGEFIDVGVDVEDIYTVTKRALPTQATFTITVSDYANIAVGSTIVFSKHDGTEMTLQFEASSGSAPSSSSGNTHYVRAYTDNNTTADNIYTAINAISGFTVSNPGAAVVTVTRDDYGNDNQTVTSSDTTRLAVTQVTDGTTKYYLEVFDDDRTTDAAIQYFTGATSPDQSLPTNTTCSSLGHLERFPVDVVRDDLVITGKTVVSSAITIDQAPTTYVEVGLSYAVEVVTLPAEPRLPSGVVVSRKRRIVEATPVLYLSQNLAVNGVEVPFSLLPATAGASSTTFTGRKRISPILGYSDEAQVTLTMTTPQFVTVLGLEYKLSTGA